MEAEGLTFVGEDAHPWGDRVLADVALQHEIGVALGAGESEGHHTVGVGDDAIAHSLAIDFDPAEVERTLDVALHRSVVGRTSGVVVDVADPLFAIGASPRHSGAEGDGGGLVVVGEPPAHEDCSSFAGLN